VTTSDYTDHSLLTVHFSLARWFAAPAVITHPMANLTGSSFALCGRLRHSIFTSIRNAKLAFEQETEGTRNIFNCSKDLKHDDDCRESLTWVEHRRGHCNPRLILRSVSPVDPTGFGPLLQLGLNALIEAVRHGYIVICTVLGFDQRTGKHPIHHQRCPLSRDSRAIPPHFRSYDLPSSTHRFRSNGPQNRSADENTQRMV
jgi:hypothetical protein